MSLEERRQMMNHLDAVMDAAVMDEPREPAELPEPGAVELDDVVFGYHPDVRVLTGVSMTAPGAHHVRDRRSVGQREDDDRPAHRPFLGCGPRDGARGRHRRA